MDIKLFKMYSGEEVIASVDVVELDGFVVSKPHLIQLVPQGAGSMGLLLIPWIVGNRDATVKINRNAMSVVNPITPAKEFEDQYLQQTSGIALAKGMPNGSGKIQM